MTKLPTMGELTAAESTDLKARIDRFHIAWTPDRSTAIEAFLPPPSARHRGLVLSEILKSLMERRVRAGLPIRVETELARFDRDILPDAMLLSLIAEEYHLRHRYADRPTLDEYRMRFPTLVDALREHLRLAPGRLPVGLETAGLDNEFNTRLADNAIDPYQTPVASLGKTAQADRQVQTPGSAPTIAPPEHHRPMDLDNEQANRLGEATADPSRTKVAPIGENVQPAHQIAANTPDIINADNILPADLEYKLLRRLGVGTFGEVFEALAPGGFRVAVKRILRSVDHPASKGEIEALEAMKAMSHPFLVQTHAYWVFRDQLVIVMDLAEGSLGGRIEYYKGQGRPGVPPDELITFFEQAAEALDYLHSQKVSHRDVKPENLLLLKGYAKVADFGLARGHSHDETVVASEVGTPLYMAPEVWARKVSLHSDQYSLAATYVTARIGRPPFSAKTLFELCYQHSHDVPNLDPLPPAEQKVLLKALAKKPDDRYPSCAAFAKALRTAVLPPVEPQRPRRRLIPWVLVAATLVIGIGVGLLAKLSWNDDDRGDLIKSLSPPEWCPNGWQPVAGIEPMRFDNDKVYHIRLTRSVAGEELVAILVVSKHPQPSDPPPYYMLENKITNRVFKKAWDDASADPNSELSRFLKVNSAAAFLLPGRWKLGAKDSDGNDLGIDGIQEAVPVVGVTAPEAMLVAAQLGGQLPTYTQWLKAVGATGDDDRPNSPGSAGPNEMEGEDLSKRPLALGLKKGPWPVAIPTNDRSIHGIHQLVSNGYEWTDGDNEAQRLNLLVKPPATRKLRLTGRSWTNADVLTFSELGEDSNSANWIDTKYAVGFRVVLMPP